jgi:hypothetical protein
MAHHFDFQVAATVGLSVVATYSHDPEMDVTS